MNDNDCGCVYTSYDGECAELSSTAQVKARKPYRCCECKDAIPVGARHERTTGRWEGEWGTYRTCLACVEIRALLCCDGWNYTALWEDVREYLNEGGKVMGCINKLESTAAKDKLAAEYRDFLELPAAAPSEE